MSGDNDLTEEELADRIPVPSRLIGGPHDGATLLVPQVSTLAFQDRYDDLAIQSIYQHDPRPAADHIPYVFVRVEPIGVFHQQETT